MTEMSRGRNHGTSEVKYAKNTTVKAVIRDNDSDYHSTKVYKGRRSPYMLPHISPLL